MKRIVLTMFAVCAGLSISYGHEGHAAIDFGGGVSLLRGDFGPSTNLDQGLGITLGVLFKNGFLLRFNVSRVESKFVGVADFGFGLEPVQETDDFIRGDATAGYLWNRTGKIRPYLRGGFAVLGLEADIDSASTGSLTVISDEDIVITYGGGVELGDGNHIFAVDFQISPDVTVEGSALGVSLGSAEFDFQELRLDYRYRF